MGCQILQGQKGIILIVRAIKSYHAVLEHAIIGRRCGHAASANRRATRPGVSKSGRWTWKPLICPEINGLENYAGLLEALGRPAEAAELRTRAGAIRRRRG